VRFCTNFVTISVYTTPTNEAPFTGPTTVTTVSLLNAISARVAAFRNRRRIANVRRTLGYREMIDIGIYRGHVDRVASAENEAI
jgi:hypothetical protein